MTFNPSTSTFSPSPDEVIRTKFVQAVKSKPVTAGRLFTTALSVLRRKGWTQNEWHTKTGEVCLMGAIEDAMIKVLGLGPSTDPNDLRAATNIVNQYLSETYPAMFEYDVPDVCEFGEDCELSDCDMLHDEPRIGHDVMAWNDQKGRTAEQVAEALEKIALKEASTPFDHLIASLPWLKEARP